VKEQNGGSSGYILPRLLYTGTPIPCVLLYATPDCSGEVLGIAPRDVTGLACGLPDGRVGRGDPTVPPTAVNPGSIWSGRYDGSDMVSSCTTYTTAVTVMPVVQDLGIGATVASRVYVEPAQ
jgi:hypothetical protein